MKNIIMLFFVVLLSGCSRYFSYSVQPELKKSFVIDSLKTKYFVRTLYLENTEYEGKEISKDSISKKNGTENMLTEIQFLFINGSDVLYITTMQSRFIFDKTGEYLINGKIPNSYFFDGMYFGRIIKDTNDELRIEFKNHKLKQIWSLDKAGRDRMMLNSVDEFEIKKTTDELLPTKDVLISTRKVEYSFKHSFEFAKADGISEVNYVDPVDNQKGNQRMNKFTRVFEDEINGKLKYVLMPILEADGSELKSIMLECSQVPFFIQ